MHNQILLLLPVLLPVIAGILVSVLKLENRGTRQAFVGAAVIISMTVTVFVLLSFRGQSIDFIQVAPGFSFRLAVDDMSVVFGLLVSILWVFTTFYAFGYMQHEGGEVRFFTFFTVAMGISVGLALSGNLITYYLFYELLTFITLPLVTHSGTDEAVKAGKKYLVYSITGATLALVSIVFVTAFAGNPDASFTFGGILSEANAISHKTLLQAMYFVGFLGFGVKSAVFPLHGWLLKAYVAPTPVTALLHAVAVVKAGVFGIMRLTYYGYGADLIKGSWVQYVCLLMIFITILYGSSFALGCRHLKKRLAYSTISQLSYILFAVMMLSPAGLVGGLIYMMFHAMSKITLFLCCGSVMYTTDTTDVRDMVGYGKIMPVTFGCFFVAGLALTGIPPTVGIVGKFYLGTAAFTSGQFAWGVAGFAVVMISAVLTALYIFPVFARAFFPGRPVNLGNQKKEPPMVMNAPILVLTLAIVLLFFFSNVVTGFITAIPPTLS